MAEYNLGTASGRIVVDGSGAKQGFSVAQAAGEAFFGTIKDQVGELDDFATKLTQLGAASSAGFGIAITAAAGFEASLSGIEAVSGATEAQMDAVRATALRLGADTKFSAQEAAGAIEELVKAGISVDDAINGAADATVALAAAGEIALPRAAEIAANAMSVFNLKAQDMPRVADLIAGAANASAIDVEQFAQSLQQSGAAANLAGITFEDLSTAIAVMGNAGIKGSDAGTSLKTMLLNLNPVTARQTDLMKKLGLITKDGSNAFFDAEGNAKSFGEIAGILQDKLGDMTKQQQLSTLETLFGADALRAAAVVMDAGTKGFDDMAAAMSKVTAESVAATRMDNLKGAIEQLKGSVETALIVIGTPFLGALRRIVEMLTALINVFNDLPEGVQNFLSRVVALGGALSLLTGIAIKLAIFLVPLLAKFLGFMALKQVFSIFARGFATLRSGAGAMAALSVMASRTMTVFGRFGKILATVFGFLKTVPGVLAALRVAIAFVFGPWGAAIALVVTALVLLYKKFAPFHDLVNRVAAAVRGGFIAALNAARTALAALAEGFSSGAGGGGGFLGFMRSAGAGARILWDALMQVGAAFKANVLPALRNAGAVLGPILVDAFKTISEAVTGSLLPAFRDLGAALAPLLPYLKQFGSFLLGLIGFMAKITAAIIGLVALGLIKLATVIVSVVLPAIINFAAFLAAKVIPVIATVIAAVIRFVAGAVAFAAAFISMWTQAKTATSGAATSIGAVLESIRAFFVSKFNAIKAVVVAAFLAVKTAILTALIAIQTVISTVVGFIQARWQAFWGSLFGQTVLNALGLVKDLIVLSFQAIRFAFLAFVAGVRALWSVFWSNIRTVAVTVWEGIKNTVRTGLAVIRAVVGTVMAAIVARIRASWNQARAVTSAVVNAIRSAVSAAWNAIRSVTAAAWAAIYARIRGPIQQAYSYVLARTAGIRAAIASAWGYVRSATAAAWNSFVSTIQSAVSRALGIVRGIRSAVIGALAGAASWLYSAGVAVIQGFLNGINAMIGRVRAKLQELTSMIPDAKGPPERDIKLLENNGKLIIQGLIKGISSEEGALFDQLGRLTAAIPQAAAAGPVTTNNANVNVTMPAGADPYQVGNVTAQRILAKSRR